MSRSYRDLIAWQKALALVQTIYEASASFPKHELYGLTSQIRRAAVSVLSNIAEAQGRLTFGESRQLLSQSRGSLYEVDAQVIAGFHLGYVTSGDCDDIRKHVVDVAR